MDLRPLCRIQELAATCEPFTRIHPPQDGSPIIHVNLRTSRSNEDMGRIWAEHVEQTEIAETKNDSTNDVKNGKLFGQNKYDLTVKTSYEYSVVKCQDYDEDVGIWVRNMPEEIRKANPDFVPG